MFSVSKSHLFYGKDLASFLTQLRNDQIIQDSCAQKYTLNNKAFKGYNPEVINFFSKLPSYESFIDLHCKDKNFRNSRLVVEVQQSFWETLERNNIHLKVPVEKGTK